MNEIIVTEQTARWLLHEAERNVALAFNSFEPHACKLCPANVPPPNQRGHLKAHRAELDKAAAKRRREGQKRRDEANRLKKEANHA